MFARSRTSLGVVAAALAVALSVVAPAGAQAFGLGSPAAAGNPHRLHVDGAALRDGRDRQVILRGIAVIRKGGDRIPPVDAGDFERIRSWGLNSIRLGVFWSATMPEPGVIDRDYLERVRQVVEAATDAGLYVVLDMHQDVWGHPHGDGAPAWATNTDCPDIDFGSLTGAWATNYFSPVVVCAFTNFWLDPELQRLYGEAWRALAETVGSNPRVAGYDLMNEPYEGLIPPGVFATRYLYPAQARWLATIRETDPDAIGFFEPPNAKNVHLPTTPPLDLPEGAVYAPHLYGLWDASDDLAETRRLAEANFTYSRTEAEMSGLPLWVGEWGVRAASPGAAGFVRDVLDWCDAALAGSSYWEYAPGASYSPLNADGSEKPLAAALVRTYPAAVTGTITSFHYDADSARVDLSWRQREEGTSVLAAPARLYPNGVTVKGSSRWSYDSAAGVLRVRAAAGPSEITVERRP